MAHQHKTAGMKIKLSKIKMVAMVSHLVTTVLWKETTFPRWRAMDKRLKRNVVSMVSSVMAVMRLPISCVNSMAMLCMCQLSPWQMGVIYAILSDGFILMQFIASHLLFNKLIYHAATSQCLKTSPLDTSGQIDQQHKVHSANQSMLHKAIMQYVTQCYQLFVQLVWSPQHLATFPRFCGCILINPTWQICILTYVYSKQHYGKNPYTNAGFSAIVQTLPVEHMTVFLANLSTTITAHNKFSSNINIYVQNGICMCALRHRGTVPDSLHDCMWVCEL